jgi:hypothetical protein
LAPPREGRRSHTVSNLWGPRCRRAWSPRARCPVLDLQPRHTPRGVRVRRQTPGAEDPQGPGHTGGTASQLGPVHRDGADGFMADHGGAASRGSGSMWKSFPTVGAPWAPPNKVRVPPRATRSLRTRSDLAAVDGGAFRSRTPLPFSTIVRIGGSGNLPTSEARQAFPYRVKLMRASFPPGLVTGRTLVQ